MIVSYKWLQTYFDKKLPSKDELVRLFTFHFAEVDDVKEVRDDVVFDLKILPDRAHYALSHKGVAYDLSAITDIVKKQKDTVTVLKPSKIKVSVKNEQPIFCRRYVARVVDGISVSKISGQAKSFLETIGERSVNNVVDLLNFVMFDIGQPLHAFDADKVEGDIVVRLAKNGEKITTLDDKEVLLDSSMLIIADEKAPLAIAGIKGGKKAEVTESTKKIIIESANFDPVSIRRTSAKIGIRNNSSKRFENEITPFLAEQGMNDVSSLISQLMPSATFGPILDICENKIVKRNLSVTTDFIRKKLGMDISDKEMEKILKKLEIEIVNKKGVLNLTIPFERMDLQIPEDIAEEIGRIKGFDDLLSVHVDNFNFKPKISKEFCYTEMIKDILIDKGFSEIITRVLGKEGDLETLYPVSKDRRFLRTNLVNSLEKSLETNARNADLLGIKSVKVFEIGKVFEDGKERLVLGLGIKNIYKEKIKEKDELKKVLEVISVKIDYKIVSKIEKENIIQIELDFFDKLKKIKRSSEDFVISKEKIIYKKISQYPFIVRDIAVFVPENVSEDELLLIIKKEAGDLLVRSTLFDVFEKTFPDGSRKKSFAFRLVFQSYDKTLSDTEINKIMDEIVEAVNSKKDWQVR